MSVNWMFPVTECPLTECLLYLEWLGVLVTRNCPLEGLDPALVTTQSLCWSCLAPPFKLLGGVDADVSGELSRMRLVWLLKELREVLSSLIVTFDRFLKRGTSINDVTGPGGKGKATCRERIQTKSKMLIFALQKGKIRLKFGFVIYANRQVFYS